MDLADQNHLPAPISAPVPEPVWAESPACANCGAVLSGRYCSACGQRVDTQAHSVGHFLSEAAEVLTHADSRVWGTLWPLLARPGFLTHEYFAGRRARYLQPFRLYLILSLVFFLLTALLGNGSDTAGIRVGVDPHKECANIHTDVPGGKWLLPRFTAACEHMVTDNGKALGEHIVHNVGRGMFVFLPLLAALMKLLYWRPKRYYLEHLLLLIHNHACVFLALSIFTLAIHWLRSSAWITVLGFAMTWYLARYLYRSMKTVYGQSGLVTFLKFNALGFAYLVCAVFMLIATTFISAMTL